MDWIKAVFDSVHSNETHTLIRHNNSKLFGYAYCRGQDLTLIYDTP